MTVQASGRPVLGIDLGGTKILAAVVAEGKTILGRAKRATPAKEGGDAIVATIVDAIHQALAESGRSIDEIAAVGVGSPGPLDPKTGVILFSANLNVHNFPIAAELSMRLAGKPVVLRNDVRVGGNGEFRLGAGVGYRSLIAAFVGTGIGGCLVMDGKIVEGSTGNAGELGHVVIKAGGPECGCGNRGCLEVFASRTAIAKRVTKAVRKGVHTVLAGKIDKKSGRLKSGDIAHAFEQGDAVAVKEVCRAAHYLGMGLGGLVNVFGPEIVIVGGGVTEALGAPFVDLVRTSLRKAALVDPDGRVKVEAALLGDDAGVLGAALFALDVAED